MPSGFEGQAIIHYGGELVFLSIVLLNWLKNASQEYVRTLRRLWHGRAKKEKIFQAYCDGIDLIFHRRQVENLPENLVMLLANNLAIEFRMKFPAYKKYFLKPSS